MTMTTAELAVLRSHIDAARHYLEFGAGESTVYAASSSGPESVDSVESSLEFLQENLLTKPSVRAALEAGRLRFHRVDLGETGMWGSPKDERRAHLWPNYSLAVFDQPVEFDLVLVDGRFRVACALASLLSTPADARIMIHDFCNRPYYHTVLDYFDIEHSVDTLVVLRKKEGFDSERATAMLHTYQYLPGDIPPVPPGRMRQLKHALSAFLRPQAA